ncbi:hypothetical protein AVEN_126964-1 [Araneus ventricosus]|uniref:Uncharacterized protein n=1 Tax=Araneus ventricosus TaxID=182803 RepID=A0A4Y2EEH7_ARAVE|nr:hypothetical protein AVEN_126964-1 [Araneus ventricosus]
MGSEERRSGGRIFPYGVEEGGIESGRRRENQNEERRKTKKTGKGKKTPKSNHPKPVPKPQEASLAVEFQFQPLWGREKNSGPYTGRGRNRRFFCLSDSVKQTGL